MLGSVSGVPLLLFSALSKASSHQFVNLTRGQPSPGLRDRHTGRVAETTVGGRVRSKMEEDRSGFGNGLVMLLGFKAVGREM